MVGQVRDDRCKPFLFSSSFITIITSHHHQRKSSLFAIIVSGSKPLRCISSKSYGAFSCCSSFSQGLMNVLGSRPLCCISSESYGAFSDCVPFSRKLMHVWETFPSYLSKCQLAGYTCMES